MPAPRFSFLPAIIAAITDVVAAMSVRSHQPDYPFRFLIYQVVMIGLALLMALPVRWVWLVAFLLLIAGVLVAAASVGYLYVPTLIAAGWVMVRRLETPEGDQISGS